MPAVHDQRLPVAGHDQGEGVVYNSMSAGKAAPIVSEDIAVVAVSRTDRSEPCAGDLRSHWRTNCSAYRSR